MACVRFLTTEKRGCVWRTHVVDFGKLMVCRRGGRDVLTNFQTGLCSRRRAGERKALPRSHLAPGLQVNETAIWRLNSVLVGCLSFEFAFPVLIVTIETDLPRKSVCAGNLAV